MPAISSLIASAKARGFELEVDEDSAAVAILWIQRGRGRKGDGREIIREVQCYAQAQGKPIILDVREGSSALERYYLELGFTHTFIDSGFGTEWGWPMIWHPQPTAQTGANMEKRHIKKVGLAAVRDGLLLVVRKRGGHTFILPGGKPEGDETELGTLERETAEEIGCRIENAQSMGVFTSDAADLPGVTVAVHLYSGELIGEPTALAEIEELAWIDQTGGGLPLAPTIVESVIPQMVAFNRIL